jgi:hypothetical protein
MNLDGLNEDFRDLLLLFADADVEFLVIGAYALALHGVPRASGDIDLFVRPTPENAAKVYAQLVQFGAPVAALGVRIGDLSRPGVIYQIGLPPRRIDVLTDISGLSFDEAWSSREQATLEGRVIPYIGRAAFIKNKEAAGRPKDLADADRLKRPSKR